MWSLEFPHVDGLTAGWQKFIFRRGVPSWATALLERTQRAFSASLNIYHPGNSITRKTGRQLGLPGGTEGTQCPAQAAGLPNRYFCSCLHTQATWGHIMFHPPSSKSFKTRPETQWHRIVEMAFSWHSPGTQRLLTLQQWETGISDTQ